MVILHKRCNLLVLVVDSYLHQIDLLSYDGKCLSSCRLKVVNTGIFTFSITSAVNIFKRIAQAMTHNETMPADG